MKKWMILITLLMSLQVTSCTTMSVWAPEGKEVVAGDDEQWTYQWKENYEPKAGHKEMKTWMRVALTPFSVVLDIATMPLQSFALDPIGFLIGDDDDDC